MDFFSIKPGSLLRARSDIIGTGAKFKSIVCEGEVVLFLQRKPYAEIDNPHLFEYHYIQGNKTCCAIVDEEKFFQLFEIIYLGTLERIDENGTKHCQENT